MLVNTFKKKSQNILDTFTALTTQHELNMHYPPSTAPWEDGWKEMTFVICMFKLNS